MFALVLRDDLAVGVVFFSSCRVGLVLFIAVYVGRASSTLSLPLTLLELTFELAEIRRSPDGAGLTGCDWPTSDNTLQPFQSRIPARRVRMVPRVDLLLEAELISESTNEVVLCATGFETFCVGNVKIASRGTEGGPEELNFHSGERVK